MKSRQTESLFISEEKMCILQKRIVQQISKVQIFSSGIFTAAVSRQKEWVIKFSEFSMSYSSGKRMERKV